MQRTASALVLALLISTAVAAQDTTVTKTEVKSDNGKVVTMTGCVEIGGGTSYVFTNITAEREKNDKLATPPGGPYALTAREGLDLSRYINQKVELTGVVIPAATKSDGDDKIELKETTKVGSSRVDLQACKLEYSIVSPK